MIALSRTWDPDTAHWRIRPSASCLRVIEGLITGITALDSSCAESTLTLKSLALKQSLIRSAASVYTVQVIFTQLCF